MRPFPGQLNPCPGATDSLCLHRHFQSRKASKGKASLCCSSATEEAFSISAQCKYWNEIAARPFCFFPPLCRLLKYASAPRAIWSGVDQYPLPVFFFLFMRILPRKALVNLSDIISEVGGVIDCGSNGERKSGRPDINIPCQFSVCLLARCSGTLGINTHLTFPPFPPSHFCLFFPPSSSLSEGIQLQQNLGCFA